MIEALFNQPDYLAAKKTWTPSWCARTPSPATSRTSKLPATNGWISRRRFKQELERASASGDPQALAGLKPALAVDTTAPAVSPDGNTVNLEKELMQMNQNALTHSL